jgi:hypothetical protein
MLYSRIIKQLRDNCAAFAPHIHGAAEFEAIRDMEKTDLPVPALYVLPVGDAAEKTSQNTNSEYQDLIEQFAVVMALDNKQDRTGIMAADSVHTQRAEVWKAILSWTPDPAYYHPIRYVSGQLIGMNRGVLYWQLNFVIQGVLDATDGFAGPALDNFNIFNGKVDMEDPSGDGAGSDGTTDTESHLTGLYTL